ncbi:hypothetical protein [Oleiagrimonas sp. MCCC 1A03011]|uniref:hypothetical protein n=1 Tax=Oleiagrimonas sp. MCCC 1A03011 TaxID=1926883 RepID=UPI0011BE24F0|nr:hypothetical protein [Oleiagrimonas sp. MCCC 1A03011]
MSNPNTSTPENFFFVEVSAVVAKLFKDRNGEMQSKNGDRGTYDCLNYSGKSVPATILRAVEKV